MSQLVLLTLSVEVVVQTDKPLRQLDVYTGMAACDQLRWRQFGTRMASNSLL